MLNASTLSSASAVNLALGSGQPLTELVNLTPTETWIEEAQPHPTLQVDVPSTFPGGPFQALAAGQPGALHSLFGSLELASATSLPGIEGELLLSLSSSISLGQLTLDDSGLGTIDLALPDQASWIGRTAYFQALEVAAGSLRVSNVTAITGLE